MLADSATCAIGAATLARSGLLRTLSRAGTWPALAHSAELSESHLIQTAPAACVVGSSVVNASWCEPPHVAGWSPMVGSGAKPVNGSLERSEIHQGPWKVIAASPCLKTFTSGSPVPLTSGVYLSLSSLILSRACTPASEL